MNYFIFRVLGISFFYLFSVIDLSALCKSDLIEHKSISDIDNSIKYLIALSLEEYFYINQSQAHQKIAGKLCRIKDDVQRREKNFFVDFEYFGYGRDCGCGQKIYCNWIFDLPRLQKHRAQLENDLKKNKDFINKAQQEIDKCIEKVSRKEAFKNKHSQQWFLVTFNAILVRFYDGKEQTIEPLLFKDIEYQIHYLVFDEILNNINSFKNRVSLK